MNSFVQQYKQCKETYKHKQVQIITTAKVYNAMLTLTLQFLLM